MSTPDTTDSAQCGVVVAFYITGHGLGHATRSIEVRLPDPSVVSMLPCVLPLLHPRCAAVRVLHPSTDIH